MKRNTKILSGLLIAAALAAAVFFVGHANRQSSSPAASAGFPSGHITPEGAACDLARSFINRDASLFADACIRPYGSRANANEYAAFRETTMENIKAEAARTDAPRGPKSIHKVYAARHLSQDGPASYGYAAFDFQDVMFVDVVVNTHDGGTDFNRTLVFKDRDGKWYVHPVPAVAPLLSAGLNDETASVQELSASNGVSD